MSQDIGDIKRKNWMMTNPSNDSPFQRTEGNQNNEGKKQGRIQVDRKNHLPKSRIPILASSNKVFSEKIMNQEEIDQDEFYAAADQDQYNEGKPAAEKNWENWDNSNANFVWGRGMLKPRQFFSSYKIHKSLKNNKIT